jgi:hypothetical protein
VKRFFSTAVLGLAATVLSITPAMAAPPETLPTEPFDIEGCDFPVQAELTGKTKIIEHEGFTTFTGPNARVTLTNTDTGESVSYVITGVIRDIPTDTGIISRFTGHNLVSGPAIDGILLMTGSHTFVGSSPEDPDAMLTESHGKVLNVCEVLAP